MHIIVQNLMKACRAAICLYFPRASETFGARCTCRKPPFMNDREQTKKIDFEEGCKKRIEEPLHSADPSKSAECGS